MEDNSNNPDQNSSNKEQDERTSKLNPTMPPVRAAFLAVIGVFILYQFGGGILMLLIFGLDLENADMNAVRLLTMGGQILLILFPALWLAKSIYEDVSTIIRVRVPNWKEFAVFTIGLIILVPLLQNYLYIQNFLISKLAELSPFFSDIKYLLDEADKYIEKTYTDILVANNFIELILIVFVVAITPSICEEVFFRGFVQKSFELQMRPWLAIFITSAFFALYHFNPYGLLALGALGVYFGFSAYLSNSIFIPMVLHFINNFSQVMIFHLFGAEDFLETDIIYDGAFESQIISFLLLLILFSTFIYYVKKHYPTIKGEKDDLSKLRS
ncbi:MAG: CPBP family intramembrane metalloprotease [Ignavibacteriae bacterium]|nr:CPBP family intramembrane metalloprotease [Ignavibacteriota bacterium]NOG99839.1 CPBP family intramembrane metalloprotease [Ignavibacteriota bacterium]